MISTRPAAHMNETCHKEVAIGLKRIPPPSGCKKIVTKAPDVTPGGGRLEHRKSRKRARSAVWTAVLAGADSSPPQDEAFDRSIALTPQTTEAMHIRAQRRVSLMRPPLGPLPSTVIRSRCREMTAVLSH
jgi:hypothetical protein